MTQSSCDKHTDLLHQYGISPSCEDML